MTHEELEDAVPLYAVGALERVEKQALEAHLLSGCVPCHTALKEYQSVAGLLPFGLKLTPPPRSLRAKIMAARTAPALTDDPALQGAGTSSLEPGEWMNHLFPPETTSSPKSLIWVVSLVIVTILGLGGYLAWSLYSKMTADSMRFTQLQSQADATNSKLATLEQQLSERENSLSQVREELQRRTAEIAELKNQLIQREAELETQFVPGGGQLTPQLQSELAVLLRTSGIKAIPLVGTDLAKQAAGILLYDPRTQKVWLYSVNLPESPSGAAYQLWAMQDKPINVGMFQVGNGQTANLLSKSLLNFFNTKKFTVTLELPGGRPQPAGPLFLIGQP
jgi:Anti-sigma-K factor rskA